MPKDSATSSVIAGVAAGFVVVTITQPIWLVKTRMQLQTNHGEVLYKNSLHAIQRMYKEEGLRVFYRGMTASYVGISESTFQFVLYERFKAIVQGYTGKGAQWLLHSSPFPKPEIPAFRLTNNCILVLYGDYRIGGPRVLGSGICCETHCRRGDISPRSNPYALA